MSGIRLWFIHWLKKWLFDCTGARKLTVIFVLFLSFFFGGGEGCQFPLPPSLPPSLWNLLVLLILCQIGFSVIEKTYLVQYDWTASERLRPENISDTAGRTLSEAECTTALRSKNRSENGQRSQCRRKAYPVWRSRYRKLVMYRVLSARDFLPHSFTQFMLCAVGFST